MFQKIFSKFEKIQIEKEQRKIFRKLRVNFTLNFGTNFEKSGIIVNSFIKQNIKLKQKKLLTINSLEKII